ncbi:hypothetical protein L3Y34_015092 [Caenorhabditis briggsae]|uniref:F-box domain-containing protein n=2 Tax=Caenorhabditis briggsae TaxID=6238 RepID=A0AAE9IYE1_CAEBR|nr:hypothetical protein L3Y34_015092 [Caenorhabditis briggsae]
MRLLKYPYLVQREILENMEYPDLFMLSFVSKNTKKLIKSTQMNRFKMISSIKYDTDRTDQPYVYIAHENSNDQIMRIVEDKETKKDDFQLSISGKTINFRLQEDDRNSRLELPERFFSPYPVITYKQCDKESVIKSIHDYLLDFFGTSVKYLWQAQDFKDTDFYIPFVSQLQNVSFCIDLWLGWNFEEMARLENFFALSPILKSIQMYARTTSQPFNPKSKFYQAESVEIDQYQHTVPDILGRFQGRQAFIRCAECKRSALIEFMNRWKSGEEFQNLEYLKIEIFGGEVLQNQILNAIEAKQLDATKQPPTHNVPKVYNWYNRNPKTDPIISHSYIVRQTDNRVATVLIQWNTLTFGVWDATEEQFLGMVN